jgi:glycosyltransferase involved in cell wall biosynthesis
MISVVIPTLNSAAHLPRALAPLVAGAAEGLIKEVIVVDGGSNDATLAFADASGCTIMESKGATAARLIEGAGAARGAWLMFLLPETALSASWLDAVSNAFDQPGAEHRAAFFRHARASLLNRLRVTMFKQPGAEQGLLIARKLYDELGGYRDVAAAHDDLIRHIGGKRLVQLKADVSVAA